MNKYEHEPLRDSMFVAIPRVSILRGSGGDRSTASGYHSDGSGRERRGQRYDRRPHRRHHDGHRRRDGKRSHEAHETEHVSEESGGAEDSASEASEHSMDSQMPEELVAAAQEAKAFMTQVKKKRVAVEQARDYYRKSSGGSANEATKARIAKLKLQLPCARCGQKGRWKDNDACPQKPKGKRPRRSGSTTQTWSARSRSSPTRSGCSSGTQQPCG